MPEKTTINPSPSARTLVLASTSPYRRELLARLGLPFAIAAPRGDEAPLENEPPGATALRLAEAKARSIAGQWSGALIVGSDQVADCDGAPVGKPGNFAAAARMLASLSGKRVVFHTGVALLDTVSGECCTALVDVTSTFRRFDSREVDAYLKREAPLDCAGAVKAEGLGIALFDAIESDDPTALIGLPLIRLAQMLRDAGVAVL